MGASFHTNDLREACQEVMDDAEVRSRYPEGLNGTMILEEVRKKKGADAFPLVSVLDVIDEMEVLYGKGHPPKIDQTSKTT